MNNEYEIVIPEENQEIVEVSGSRQLLNNIRPQWKAKSLITRVERLLPVDPSSACQRVFNAAIHDLREKIVIAGIDIAKEAASNNKFPSITNETDILERYTVSRIIDLSYYMGLLSRPEWRKMTRVYDIRKDLEHEDDEYEAGVEDCVYIFKTCVDVVLSKDPVQLLKLSEIKDIVEEPNVITLDEALLEDYQSAPVKRQEEIYNFLISTANNNDVQDIVRQNCFISLWTLRDKTHKDVILKCAKLVSDKYGRSRIELKEMRVAYAAGIMPYFKVVQRKDFFNRFYENMVAITFHWKQFDKHGRLLRDFIEVGGFDYMPQEAIYNNLVWLIRCYIGEPGGYGYYGTNRKVFYSDSAESLIEVVFKSYRGNLKEVDILKLIEINPEINRLCKDKYIRRRFDHIIDIINE